MARQKRIWYPGAIYHVMSRGNRRTAIFQDYGDYLHFLEVMKTIKEKYPFKVHSLCLMTNHFHMAIETISTELWRIMQKLLSLYAEEFNHKHSFTGHLFEGRYTACIIEDERYFLEVSRYIHLNPVKAKMVREPLDYEYSSYPLFMSDSLEENASKISSYIAELIDTSRVFSYFDTNPKEQYRMFVEGKISHEEQELLIQKDMKEDEMWLPGVRPHE
ncbi:MAG: transposase [Lachnospiraceae bacterium]|nr:transposase [Lachnospiraceae bacterium]